MRPIKVIKILPFFNFLFKIDIISEDELTNRSQELTTEGSKTEGSSKKALESTEDEKAVINLLKANSPIDLNALKEQAGLSNKKWDKAIKGLTKNKLARVEKTDEGLFVSLV